MIESLLFVSLKTCLPICLYICMFEKKILKHQNTRKLYICLKIRMFGTLHTCMFVYLKAGCSVFAILSG